MTDEQRHPIRQIEDALIDLRRAYAAMVNLSAQDADRYPDQWGIVAHYARRLVQTHKELETRSFAR